MQPKMQMRVLCVFAILLTWTNSKSLLDSDGAISLLGVVRIFLQLVSLARGGYAAAVPGVNIAITSSTNSSPPPTTERKRMQWKRLLLSA
jgi:hypothetical protein